MPSQESPLLDDGQRFLAMVLADQKRVYQHTGRRPIYAIVSVEVAYWMRNPIEVAGMAVVVVNAPGVVVRCA